MHHTRHGHAELRLGIVHGVAAEQGAVRFVEHCGPSLEHVAKHVDGESVLRPPHHLEGRQGRASHGIHVAQGIGRGDPAPVVCLVDDGGDEVDGLYEGDVVAQAIDAGVVGAVDADQQVLVAGRPQVV